MKKILPPEKIYVSKSKIINAGRGVFANADIKIGEIIETCVVISVPMHDLANINESILNTYFFYHGKKKDKLFVALGFGSIYNHMYKPNAKYKIISADNTIEFIALRNIKKDEEITVNYSNSERKPKNPLWFEIK